MSDGLFPPAGAEPGSTWQLVINRDGLKTYASETWDGAGWKGFVWCSAEASWDYGWRLDDPHGLAAAHRVMEEAGLTMLTLGQTLAGYWHVAGSVDPVRSFFGTGPSALAAALDAVRAMRKAE